MLTHYTRKRLEEEKQSKEPAQEQPKEKPQEQPQEPKEEQFNFEFAEESTPQIEVAEDSEQKSKRKKKGE